MTESLNEHNRPQNKLIEPHESALVFLLAVAANLAVQIVFAFAMSPYLEDMSDETQTLWSFIGAFLIQAAYLLVYFVLVKHKNLCIQYHFKNRISPLSALLCACAGLCLLGMLFLPTLWVDDLLRLTGYNPPPLTLGPANIAVCVIAIAVAAPIIEEFMFRGVLLSGLARGGIGKGVLCAAFAFMLSHFNPAQTFYQFFIGVLCGYVVVTSGSLWAGIITHAVSNTAVLVLELTPAGGMLLSFTASLNAFALVGVAIGAFCVFGGAAAAAVYGLKRVCPNAELPVQVPPEATKRSAGRTCFLAGCAIAAVMWVATYVTVVFGL